jgi:hypothetical protein
MMSPYEKLKLNPMTDNACAELLQKESNKLFNQIFEQNKRA